MPPAPATITKPVNFNDPMQRVISMHNGYVNRVNYELRPYVPTILVPRAVAYTTRTPVTTGELHPTIDLSTARIKKGGGFTIINFDTTGKKGYFAIAIDPKTSVAAIVFRKLHISNFCKNTIKIGSDVVDCREKLFVLIRLAFMNKLDNHQNEAHFADVWTKILQGQTPRDANDISRKNLRPELFNAEKWDADSMEHMFTTLLIGHTQDEHVFKIFNDLTTLVCTHGGTKMCFIEGDDKVWGSGASGEQTMEGILKLDTINPATITSVVKQLGGKNKLGQAMELLADAVIDSEATTRAEFERYVTENLPPLIELEPEATPSKTADAPPPTDAPSDEAVTDGDKPQEEAAEPRSKRTRTF
jgi:predicted NAD-dependent protein-ADP-ribosyltransferase YbiA (DUF1768 family)